MGRLAWLTSFVVLLILGSTTAWAQSGNTGSGAERVIAAYRLAEGEAITIDGRLDEAFWARVDVATDFRQLDPVENAVPRAATRVRVAYDAQTLYVAWEVDETGLADQTRAVLRRDGPVYQDDHVRLALDPHRTGRNTYNFDINANGARLDFLFENNITIRGAWNIDWQAATDRHENGWTAEMAIPFRNLSYPGNGDDWGIDFARVIQHEFENNRWAQHDQALGGLNASNMGRLSGIHDIDNGIGLEVEAFASTRYTHVWEEPGREDDLVFTTSGNAYYKITDALTGTLTVNTDFSNTPLDPRIVSTSRFGTFFSETRDFFLQDSAIFEFGGRGFADSRNGTPFFSRRIGFVHGQVIDLMGGAKLSGRWQGHDVGALVTYMDDGRDFDRQVLGVGRISHPFGTRTKLGGILVAGDPTGETQNVVGGIDLQYAYDLDGGEQLSAEIYALNSYTDGDTDFDQALGQAWGQAWGGVFRYNSDPLFLQFVTKHLEEGYNPALGFMNRPEIRDFQVKARRRWRPEGTIFRNIDVWAWSAVTTDLGLSTESREHGASFEGSLTTSDYWGVSFNQWFERIDEPFDLPGDVTVENGDYWFQTASLRLGGANSRVLSPRFEVECCNIFDGDFLRLKGNLRWRPAPVFSLEWNNSWRRIELKTGTTEIYVTGLEGIITFSPDMQLRTEVQYDNISGNVNVFSRFKWEFSPGSELFIGVGHNADMPARDFANEFSSNVSTVTVRVGRTFSY